MDKGTHSAGKAIRLSRLFDECSGRSVVVALDHGHDHGAMPGLENMGNVLTRMREEAPDALIVRAAHLKRYPDLFCGRRTPAAIVALDSRMNKTFTEGDVLGEEHRLLVSVDEAAALGADAVKVLLIFGRRDLSVHADNLERVARVIERSEQLGIPVMVEATLWGLGVPTERQNDASLVPHIARVGFELGADVLKLPYAPGVFPAITEQLPVPVMILGGAKVSTDADLDEMVASAVGEGVRGVAFGRNVWQAADPVAVVRRLKQTVHGRADYVEKG